MANTLFPPVLESWLPAFIADEGVHVPWTLSSLTGGGPEIEYSLRYLSNNKEVDNKSHKITRTNPFFIPGDKFQAGQSYKLQARFCGAGESEWSRVCLLKAINRPALTTCFDDIAQIGTDTPIVTGQLDTASNETLGSYVIKLYDNTDELIYDSKTIYSDPYSPNSIYHIIPLKLTNGMTYTSKISYTTANGYQGSKDNTFVVRTDTSMSMDCEWTAEPDLDNGGIHLHARFIKGEDIDFRRIVITRASSEDNFVRWEDMKVVRGSYEADFDDFTVKSGVYYQYGIQLYAPSNKTRSNMITLDEPVMLNFEGSFLTTKDMQFNVIYNSEVSSYKRTVLENKTDTIGGKYPYIRRNAATEYRQFALSGLISWESDKNETFIKETDIYKDPNLYKEKIYDEDNNIIGYNDVRSQRGGIQDSLAVRNLAGGLPLVYDLTGVEVIDHYDYIYEREFREKIMDYLYDEGAKLFRSTTEGNILVKLMDVTLTPSKELGRMIYSFSCTAVEIDENTVDNYKAYGIIPWEERLLIEVESKHDTVPIAQVIINPRDVGSGNILTSLLSSKHSSLYASHNESITSKVTALTYLKLTFFCEPRKPGESENSPAIQEPAKIQLNNGKLIHGFRFKVNGSEVVVKDQQVYLNHVDDELRDAFGKPAFNETMLMAPYHTGMYVFNGATTDIRDLSFYEEDNYKVYIEYSAQLDSTETVDPLGGTSAQYSYQNVTQMGQLWRRFSASEEFYNLIYNYYSFNYTNSVDPGQRYFCRFISLDGIEVETTPGTQIEYKLRGGSLKTVTVDHTGYFQLNEPDMIIESFRFPNGANAYVNYIVELLKGQQTQS